MYRAFGVVATCLRSHTIALALVLCSAAPLSAADDSPRGISIYVGSQLRDGYTDVDRGILASIKDIRDRLRKRKPYVLLDDRGNALLVLEVVSRGATSTAGGGAVAVPIGGTVFAFPMGTVGIATVLRAGTYEKPIVFQNCQAWGHCAELVVKDVDAWLAANRSTLLSR